MSKAAKVVPIQARPNRLLRIVDVKTKTGMSRSLIYQLEARGEFPRRVCLSARRVAWVEEEIDAFIAAKMAARNEASVGA